MPDHNIAVSVRGVSKSYTILHESQKHTTAAEAIVSGLRTIGKKQTSETFWALKDVSFDIQKGDVVGIIGRNGAGKSTLLKILSRITEPTSGQIDLYGRVGSLLEVGTGFHPELTGRENIFLNGAVLGMSRREIVSHFDTIVDFAGVEKFLDTPVKRYSSGMYVRLAFAVAAHLEPEILIVDEVLAVGDAEFQQKCLGKMQDVAAHGRTVIFVSHNMAAVTRLCRRALFFQGGQLLEDGPAETIVDRYFGHKGISDALARIDPSQHNSQCGGTSILQLLDIMRHDSPAAQFQFLWREPIRLLLRFQAHQAVRNVTFGLGISTAQGTPLLGSHHNDRQQDLLSFEPGIHQCLIELQNDLRPGLYTLEIGAETLAGHAMICLVPEALTFQVTETSVDEIPFNFGCHGVMNGYGHWQFSRASVSDTERSATEPLLSRP